MCGLKSAQKLADGIDGAERRAHVVLSSRFTDWEFRRDFGRLKDLLPIPEEQIVAAAPTPDELLISTIRHKRRQEEYRLRKSRWLSSWRIGCGARAAVRYCQACSGSRCVHD